MNPPPPDPYKALGVDKSADVTTIKSAYRKLVLKCHPDKVQDPTLKAAKQDEFQRVQQAYEVLVDETKRKEYDLDAKMRRMRAEAARNVSRQPPTPRSSPKDYSGFNVRTAEPPSSFKPGPPPSPYSPVYTASSPLHSHSWDRDMPYRTKAMYDDGHRARRTASYEKPREVPKEERRRQKEEDDEATRGWAREKEQREKEQREREREREKKARSEREKEEKREKQKREMDRRDKERDRARRQDQQEKSRSRKAAYVEPYDESDEERRAYNKKKSSMSGVGASSGGSSSKKHAETPRRDRSARRDDEPRAELHTEPLPDNYNEKMKRAADYMFERRGSKNNMPAAHFTEGVSYNSHFPDPEVAWHVAGGSPRPRRPSQDEKKFRSRAEEADDDVDRFMGTPERRPPRLTKSYTSPAGAIHIPNSSAPRAPPLGRAATMDYSRTMPQVPSAPPESGRGKPERRRRGSFDAADEDMRPRRSSTNPRVLHYPVDETSPIPRTGKSSYYSHGDDYYQPPSRTKTMPFPSGQIYETKRYSDNDIVYSTVNHSADHYSSSHPPYVRAYD